MPRQPRLDVADIPQHGVQRGNDRQLCFFKREDHQRNLDELREISLMNGREIHAHVLMNNYVHMLLPPAQTGRISALLIRPLNSLEIDSRADVRNQREVPPTSVRGEPVLSLSKVTMIGSGPSGPIDSALKFEVSPLIFSCSQKKGSNGHIVGRAIQGLPVDNDSQLLHCHHTIELNPIRAHVVADAGGYEWSSYRYNALGEPNLAIRAHSTLALGSDFDSRCIACKPLVDQCLALSDLDAIRGHLQRQHALGTDRSVGRSVAKIPS